MPTKEEQTKLTHGDGKSVGSKREIDVGVIVKETLVAYFDKGFSLMFWFFPIEYVSWMIV